MFRCNFGVCSSHFGPSSAWFHLRFVVVAPPVLQVENSAVGGRPGGEDREEVGGPSGAGEHVHLLYLRQRIPHRSVTANTCFYV